MKELPRLHVVTDDAVLETPGFLDRAVRVMDRCGGAVALHVRGHTVPGARLHAMAERLAAGIGDRSDAWLMINDRVDIAMAVRAHGVQLGERSLHVRDARSLLPADARIGCSVHDAAAAETAETGGADFVVAGTVYETASHTGRAGAGVAFVQGTAARVAIPVIAIGGITTDRVAAVMAAGAYGIAVLGGVWGEVDAAAAAAAYVDAIEEAQC